MAYKLTAREKEIENRLRKDYFAAFDAEEVLGDVDFAVGIPQDELQLLILTVGQARVNVHIENHFSGNIDNLTING